MHFTHTSSCIIYGTHLGIVQNMLDYDYLCGRDPSVKAVYSSQSTGKKYKVFYGNKEFFLPTIYSREQVAEYHEVDTLINLASFRSCTAINKAAIHSGHFKHIFTIAEGVPERETRELIALAKSREVDLFGPSIVGAMIVGVFRIAHTGGSLENIIASRLTTPGSVGIVTKSGGMMNELCRIVSKHTNGVHSAFQIGGDRFPMMSFRPIIEYLNNNDDIKMIVLLGEVGNRIELEIADMIAAKKIKKPVVAWCIGISAENMSQDVQFGHAGAKANSDEEKASYKNTYLRDAGAQVPESFQDFGEEIGRVRSDIRR